jgi:hypothetical protein
MLTVVLYCVLVSLIGAFAALFFTKRDGKKFETINSIATLIMAVATIIIGISTVNVAKQSEEIEKLSKQPLFTVKINPEYSEEKHLYDKEEFVVTNDGHKTKVKTIVSVCSFLEIEYHDIGNHKDPIRKRIPIIYFNGAAANTNNLDGVISCSFYTGNNNECFFNIYKDALRYGEEHPDTFITVEKENYFVIDYVDIYDEHHHIVKTEETEIDPAEFEKIKKEAYQNTNGKPYDIEKLNLEFLLSSFFPEIKAQ